MDGKVITSNDTVDATLYRSEEERYPIAAITWIQDDTHEIGLTFTADTMPQLEVGTRVWVQTNQSSNFKWCDIAIITEIHTEEYEMRAKPEAYTPEGYTAVVGLPVNISPLPEWLQIPEWATPLKQQLTMSILPEAIRRGIDAVFIRANNIERFYVGPIWTCVDKGENAQIAIDWLPHTPADRRLLIPPNPSDLDWDTLQIEGHTHILLDSWELRWGGKNGAFPGKVLFNEEVDLSGLFDSPNTMHFDTRLVSPRGKTDYAFMVYSQMPDRTEVYIHQNSAEWDQEIEQTRKQALQYLHNTLGQRRQRPADLATLLPIDRPIRLWTQTHFTSLLLDVHGSTAQDWTYHAGLEGYYLQTAHGRALVEGTKTLEALQAILDTLGAEALQCELAALCHIEEQERRKHGKLPKFDDITPITVGASQLLKSMGREPDGNTFSRRQQLKARKYLKAAARIEYMDITPTEKGKRKLQVGPVVSVVGTSTDIALPFDDLPPADEIISLKILPGETAWEMIRSGVSWCHPQLLKYHPEREKYEIAIGFYLLQIQANRRNKLGQDYISISSIDAGSGVNRFDTRDRRRLPRIEKALHKLAADGVIGGIEGKAVIESDPAVNETKLKVADALRSKRLRLLVSKDLPALQQQLPKPKKNSLSK